MGLGMGMGRHGYGMVWYGMGMGRPPTERRPNRESRAEAQYSPQARMGQHGFLFVGECH